MKRRFTEDSWRKEPWFKGLVSAMLSCKTEHDMENMLRDVATLSEIQALSERLEVARLLTRGLSYRQIAAQTGASTTTVTRVAHFLENGEGGYRKVLNAHRHHRMQTGRKLDVSDNALQPHPSLPAEEQAASSGEQRPKPGPVSPLQKYLDRR